MKEENHGFVWFFYEGIDLTNLDVGGGMDIALSGDSGRVASPAAMMPQCRGDTMEARPAPAGPKHYKAAKLCLEYLNFH